MNYPVLITEAALIEGVADAWEKNYACSDYPDKMAVLVKLRGLPKDASSADVAAIIGNRSWTSIYCDGCDQAVSRAVRVGDEPDYESSTTVLCESCLRLAIDLMFPETAK